MGHAEDDSGLHARDVNFFKTGDVAGHRVEVHVEASHLFRRDVKTGDADDLQRGFAAQRLFVQGVVVTGVKG